MKRPPRNGSHPIDPADYAGIVGATFVKRERQAVLQIGALTWNRWELGRLGCPHPMAAATLNRVLQHLKVASLQDVAARAHEIGTYTGIGVTAYWALLSILREHGFDVEQVHGEAISYHTMKQHEKAKTPPKGRKRR